MQYQIKKAQNGRRESMKIMSDKYVNYKYNLKIRQKNAQKTEHVFGIRLLIIAQNLSFAQ